MKLNPEQLSKQLQQGLKPIYLFSGDETLLLQEACDSLRAAAKQQGFIERECHYAENIHFNWDDVFHSVNSMSLFAERKLLEIHFKSAKVGDSGSKAIQALLKDLNPDILLLLIMPKLDSASTRSKWYKAIEAAGASCQVWPVERPHLPRWIQSRLQQRGLSASDEAVEFLADNVEGNLLAAQQEIEKLCLLNTDKALDLQTMTAMISNSSRYTVFNFTDRCLAGDAQTALKTLYGLKAEGNDALSIIALLNYNLRILHRLHHAQSQGESLHQAMRSERIFESRQRLMQSALGRLSPKKLEAMLCRTRLIDQSVKGLKQEPPWLLLEQITMGFCR